MRAVSYTRTTTCVPFEEVPADIIKHQNDRILEFCKNHRFKISHKYSDRKYDSDEETEFRELLADGMKHKFDLVVVDSIFRSGCYIGSAKEVLCKTLHASGVYFAVVEDDFISIGKSNEEVFDYIDSKYNEFNKLQKRQYALKRIQDGVFTQGEAKFGYDVVDGKLEINEAEADIVRRIFNEFVSGKSVVKIADGLNANNVMVPSMARGMRINTMNGWNPSRIRTMIRNTVYRGDFERKYEEVIVRCECPAIVSCELFENAQKCIKSIATVGDYSRKSIFSGMIKDINDSIGYTYRNNDDKHGYKPSHIRFCRKKFIAYEEVEALVEELFSNMSKEALRIKTLIETEGEMELNKVKEDISNRMRELGFRLASIEKEKMSLSYIPEDLYDERQEIENSFQILEKELATMEKAISLKNPWLVRYLNLNSTSELNQENFKMWFKKIYFDRCVFDHFEVYEQNWYDLLPEKWRK